MQIRHGAPNRIEHDYTPVKRARTRLSRPSSPSSNTRAPTSNPLHLERLANLPQRVHDGWRERVPPVQTPQACRDVSQQVQARHHAHTDKQLEQ